MNEAEIAHARRESWLADLGNRIADHVATLLVNDDQISIRESRPAIASALRRFAHSGVDPGIVEMLAKTAVANEIMKREQITAYRAEQKKLAPIRNPRAVIKARQLLTKGQTDVPA